MRIRDVNRGTKPQARIGYAEWDDIVKRFNHAVQFTDENNPIYLSMQEDLKNLQDIILENRLHEVHEVKTVTKVFKKIFITPRQEQMDELIGQVKYLKALFHELNSWILRKEELEKMEANGQIEIERNER